MDAVSIANLRAALTTEAASIGDGEFAGIWPDNLDTAKAFFAVNGQWRVVTRSAGGYASHWGGMLAPTVPMFLGLDYTAVKFGLEADGIAITPELWRGLRAMEEAACKILNEDG